MHYEPPDSSIGSASASAVHAGILFAPVLAAAAVGRLIEFENATSGVVAAGASAWHLGEVALATVVGLGVTLWAGMVRAGRSSVEAIGLTVAACSGFTVAFRHVLPVAVRPWLGVGMLEYIRLDVLVVLVVGGALAFALGTTSGAGRCRVLRIGRVVAVMLFSAFSLDAAYLATIGAPLDGELALYTARHASSLMPVIATEIRYGALAVPGCLLVALCASLAYGRRTLRGRWGVPRQALALVAVAVVGLAAVPEPSQGLLARVLDPGRREATDATSLAHAVRSLDTRTLQLARTDSSRQYNVVIVVLESTRRRSTTPYSPGLATTPFLDSLARQGALVERMTTTVPHTNKSIVSVFGGVYPYPHPEWAASGAEALPVRGLPALLRDIGYRTAFFTPAEFSYERKDRIVRSLGFEDLAGATDLPDAGFALKAYFGHEDRVMLGPALSWIDRQTAAGRPFMLGMLTLTSHHPYDTPPDWPLQTFSSNPELNQYLNALHYQDAFLADLWRGIERRGLAGNTALVVLGDHGEAFGEHGFRTHSEAVWDEILEVPGVIVAPGVVPGTRVRGERSTLDILPTVADVLGYRLVGADLPGSSLLRPIAPDRVLYHYSRASDIAGAIRRGSRKTMTWWGRRPSQAFDLASDPDERVPLSGQDEMILHDEREFHRWRAAAVAFYRGLALRPRV